MEDAISPTIVQRQWEKCMKSMQAAIELVYKSEKCHFSKYMCIVQCIF